MIVLIWLLQCFIIGAVGASIFFALVLIFDRR